jgi:uncharacterized protein (DUF362 family)
VKRRTFLTAAGATVAAGMVLKSAREHDEASLRADVLIARAGSYSDDLEPIIRQGLRELGLGPAAVKGKTILLKPNLVEPTRSAPHINTHPRVVIAVAEVFRRWQARLVLVAEGQGHCRDSQYVLDESGLGDALTESRLEFVDLNHDDIAGARNELGFTSLENLMLPVTLRRADLIVSLPKMKTHHWAGVTLAAGVLVMGTNLPAVDATCARIMGIDPWKVAYLAGASGRLGPIAERHIAQRGEALGSMVQPFQLLDDPSMTVLSAGSPR